MFATFRRIALAAAGVAALTAAGQARADHDCDWELESPPDVQPPAYYQPQDYPPPAYYQPQGYPPPAYQPQDYAPPAYQQEYPVYQPPAYAPQEVQAYGQVPVLRFSVALPAPPAWLAVAPPPYPVRGMWSRAEVARQVRWLELARTRFYQRAAWNPWRVRQFDAWYQARRAELDRRWNALAWAPAPRHGWRNGWDGDQGWHRGRWDRDRDGD